MAMVTFGVLGPLTARDDRGPIRLKGPRHRSVLARLLVARGRVVPVSWLIDDLWDVPPAGALGALQTFVADLRKALEHGRPPRAPSRLLITSPPGYALRTEPGEVDALRFESLLAQAADLPAEQARESLDTALGLWRGPAYAEFADQGWAVGEAARLSELRLLAVERRASAVLRSGRAAEAIPDLEAHVTGHPLREDGWRLLALALYRTGRQGDALGTLRRARKALREELGVDPGEDLRHLEADILAQSPHLTAGPSDHRFPGATTPDPGPRVLRAPDALRNEPDQPAAGPADQIPRSHRPGSGGRPFVGRVAELGELERAAAGVVAGRSGLVLVSGAAGAGKTALLRTLARRLERDGWHTAWGSSPELPGAPAAWPWAQIHANLTAPAAARDAGPAATDAASSSVSDRDEGDGWSGGGSQGVWFRRRRGIVAAIAAFAAERPLLLVLDDLHWADEETLALLTMLAAELGPAPVLVVGTYRSTEISPGLGETLGRVARAEPTRMYLGGLAEAQVRELVRAVATREMSDGDARTIHARSGGNPFFVRELTRVWESEGEQALHTVPAGVRDVIRHRLAALPDVTRTHLRQAAVLGDEVDLDVLIPLTGADEDRVLDSVESALLAGFLVERDAGRSRFAHALVREALYEDIPHARRARWHATAAGIVERLRPGDVEAIAHHCLRARGRAGAARTARYARAAAERAERRSAPHEAARLWRETLAALDQVSAERRDAAQSCEDMLPAQNGSGGDVRNSDGGGVRERLVAVMGLGRALAVCGELPESRRFRAEAVGAAEAIGDPVLTAKVIGSFDVPAIWTANDDPALSARLVDAAERTLAALPPGHERERARLLVTIAMERRADPGRRGERAAREAEEIARRSDDRTLLAYALNGRYMQSFHRAGLAPERAAIGAALLGLSDGHDEMVTFAVLGRLVLLQASAALADLDAADRHAEVADRLAERHDLPLVGVFTTWYAALRLAALGRTDEARTAYRTAAARLGGTGMPGVEDGILPLALLCLEVGEGVDPGRSREAAAGAWCRRDGGPAGVVELAGAEWGPYEGWARPLVLLAQGRRGEAFEAARAVPDSPPDLLLEARTCLHVIAVVATSEGPIDPAGRRLLERLRERLLPAEGELAGAGSGLVTLGPVALYLGHLAAALGRRDEAAGYFRKAASVAGA
ncbi:transcriptional regulator [Nonomuraea fuscirosea]|uniref:Transcriptional regulator n=1 Tax=Nonomuraea fuscirosea TaxID=1291556 RepID=A0A2T0MTJ9_9ACTN|nr:BTAD domain-containing putative transcriptional regulator [Nonomuraea fuscirosea]PRX61918.1 transcriptional regulator [Nonomuraea fuscirosea]